MKLQQVKEPLNDPNNTLEMLVAEIRHQAMEAAKPMPEAGNIVALFKEKAETVKNAQEVHKAVLAEILRRFNELNRSLEYVHSAIADPDIH